MRSPKISVVMPVYNTKKYLRQAIESILNQTFRDFEFIIVDDCSTDSSPEIIEEYAKKDKRIRALYNSQNLKVARARNRGIEAATGRYVAQMDSDDISLPNRLKKQFKFMEGHPEVAVSSGTVELIDQAGKAIGRVKYYLTDEEVRRHIFRLCPCSQSLCIMRRKAFNDIEGYDPDWVPTEDTELFLRLGRIGQFANLSDVMLQYRVHPDSLTNKYHLEAKRQQFLLIKKAVRNYGYKMSKLDKLIYLYQYIVPCKARTFIFKKLIGYRFGPIRMKKKKKSN